MKSLLKTVWSFSLKFIYSKKAKKFCEISTVDLATLDKYTVEISHFMTFSEYMNFTITPSSGIQAIRTDPITHLLDRQK